jgi:hypothetical protein
MGTSFIVYELELSEKEAEMMYERGSGKMEANLLNW